MAVRDGPEYSAAELFGRKTLKMHFRFRPKIFLTPEKNHRIVLEKQGSSMSSQKENAEGAVFPLLVTCPVLMT